MSRAWFLFLFLTGAAVGQEISVGSTVPEGVRGTTLEDVVFLKREFGPLGTILGFFALASWRGWLKNLRFPPVRHVHEFQGGSVQVRLVRGPRQPAPAPTPEPDQDVDLGLDATPEGPPPLRRH